MRASATSKIASPASLHAPQAKNDANKGDAASPFALLVDSAAPRPKPASDKKPTQDSENKGDSRDHKTAADHDTAQTSTKSVQAGKTDKSDKSDKTDNKIGDKAGDKTGDKMNGAADSNKADAVQAADLQLVETPAPVPAPSPAVTATAATDGPAITDITAAPAVAGQAAKGTQNNQPAAPAAGAADDQAEDEQAVAGTGNTDIANSAAPAKPAAAKPGAAKAAADDPKPARADDGKAAANSDAHAADIKSADIKADALQSDKNAAADTPKPAPQPVQAAGNSLAPAAAPQTQQASNAPATTQHVQVTAQPAANLPALAVAIAARSQSGARQFDIRLDPPELGRVDVRLSIDAAGKTSAHLSADQPQTLDLLQEDAPSLTRALRDAGLDVSQDGLNFSLRQQSHDGGGNNNSGNGQGASRAFSLTASTTIDSTAISATWRGTADGRLDIRV